jgi:hypothetical protein
MKLPQLKYLFCLSLLHQSVIWCSAENFGVIIAPDNTDSFVFNPDAHIVPLDDFAFNSFNPDAQIVPLDDFISTQHSPTTSGNDVHTVPVERTENFFLNQISSALTTTKQRMVQKYENCPCLTINWKKKLKCLVSRPMLGTYLCLATTAGAIWGITALVTTQIAPYRDIPDQYDQTDYITFALFLQLYNLFNCNFGPALASGYSATALRDTVRKIFTDPLWVNRISIGLNQYLEQLTAQGVNVNVGQPILDTGSALYKQIASNCDPDTVAALYKQCHKAICSVGNSYYQLSAQMSPNGQCNPNTPPQFEVLAPLPLNFSVSDLNSSVPMGHTYTVHNPHNPVVGATLGCLGIAFGCFFIWVWVVPRICCGLPNKSKSINYASDD